MPITLKKETRGRLAKALKIYLIEHHDLDIGDLQSQIFLDSMLKTVGPAVYNQAIADAEAFLQDKLIDLEATFFVPEDSGK